MFANPPDAWNPSLKRQQDLPAIDLLTSPRLKLASKIHTAQVCYEQPAKRLKLSVAQSPKELPVVLTPRAPSIYLSEPRGGWIEYWAEHKVWPPEFFSFQEYTIMSLQDATDPSTSLAEETSATSGAQTGNTPKSKRVKYQDSTFDRILELQGSFMTEHEDQCSKESRTTVAELLNQKVTLPQDRIYQRPKYYLHKIEALQRKNETFVDRELFHALIPLASEGEDDAGGIKMSKLLIETSNEDWTSCVRISRLPRPKPDYSAGFMWSAFTESQRATLSTYFIDGDSPSPFKAHATMLFPFMSCEVKGSGGNLNVAANQNINTMTVALRGICKLFELANMYDSIDGMILGFAFAFDARELEIWGHYPRINSSKRIELYRTRIKEVRLKDDSEANKWISYRFARGLWDDWAPKQFKRIQEAVDKLPMNSQKLLPAIAVSGSSVSTGMKRQRTSSGTSISVKKTQIGSTGKAASKPAVPPFSGGTNG